MKEIIELIEMIREQNEKYGDSIQPPANNDEILVMNNKAKEVFNIKLQAIYIEILKRTNGIDNDGTVLYSSDTQKIIGYEDRNIEGIISANNHWQTENVFDKYFFYAESDLYLFVQSIEGNMFTCRSRDNFDSVIFSTKNAEFFFGKILRCSLGEYLE